MQFGMPTLIENRTLADNVALCRRLGLRFIELNMNFPEYQVDRLEQTDALVAAAVAAGIYETVRRTILVAEALLPLRDRFGDSDQPLTVNMHMHHGIFITLPDRKVQMYDRDFDTYMRVFGSFRALCEEWIGDSDVRIVIENTDGFRPYEQKTIEYLLESPCFGLTWDIGHSKAVHEKDVPFLLAHEDRLLHFHIHDGTETPPRNHLALGDGEIDLPDRLRLAQSRNARCVLETKTIEALERSVAWLDRKM